MSPHPGPQPRRTTGVLLFTAAFLAIWTAWALFLVHHPLPPQAWPIRLIARLTLFLAPTFLYIRLFLHERPQDYLLLSPIFLRPSPTDLTSTIPPHSQTNPPHRGKAQRRPGSPPTCLTRTLLFIAMLLPLTDLLLRSLQAHALPKFPHAADVWLNVILAAPLTEEILFRGLLFRELSRATSPIQGAIYSSLLFAALHFPYWYFSGAKTALELATSMPFIFAVGLLCCALTQMSRTLLAAMVFHFLNNLASSCTF